jgi:hypothetical protein
MVRIGARLRYRACRPASQLQLKPVRRMEDPLHTIYLPKSLEEVNRRSMSMRLRGSFSPANLARKARVEQWRRQYLPIIPSYPATAAAVLLTPHRSRVNLSLSLLPALQWTRPEHHMSWTLMMQALKGEAYTVHPLHKPDKNHLCQKQDMASNLQRPNPQLQRLSRLLGLEMRLRLGYTHHPRKVPRLMLLGTWIGHCPRLRSIRLF